jgi:TetR/AcrR family transcriptional regulator of autoinduction and epiphytic fitness
MTDPIADSSTADAPSGRHAAGADPAKRDQILTGAMTVFMEMGFDAAGVNDICRAANVSKSTLYVYFDNKEELFQATISRERDRLFQGVSDILLADIPPEERLFQYGCRVVALICSDQVVKAHRIMIAIAARMPALGARYYQSGAMRAQTELGAFLSAEVKSGRMTIPDTQLAAAQFLDLASADLWKPRIFGQKQEPPSDAEITSRVKTAVAMFMAVYQSRG